jgi:hypothetical protein
MHRRVAGTEADPTVEFAELEVDGKTYHLAYDFGAIAEAEKALGCNLLAGMAGVMVQDGYYSASQVLGLLYAALRKAQPKMTIQEAGRLCRIETIPEIVSAIREAYNKSLPEAKKPEHPIEAGNKPAEI